MIVQLLHTEVVTYPATVRAQLGMRLSAALLALAVMPGCTAATERMPTWTYPRRALTTGLYAAVVTGNFYGFGLYSGALKKQFNFTQSELSNINTVPYTLGVIAPIWGALGRRLGLRPTLLIGGTLICSLQVLMYLFASGRVSIPKPAVTLVVVTCLTYCGNSIVTSVAFSTPVLHYPRARGPVTALVKSFVGMGGAPLFRLAHGYVSDQKCRAQVRSLLRFSC